MPKSGKDPSRGFTPELVNLPQLALSSFHPTQDLRPTMQKEAIHWKSLTVQEHKDFYNYNLLKPVYNDNNPLKNVNMQQKNIRFMEPLLSVQTHSVAKPKHKRRQTSNISAFQEQFTDGIFQPLDYAEAYKRDLFNPFEPVDQFMTMREPYPHKNNRLRDAYQVKQKAGEISINSYPRMTRP